MMDDISHWVDVHDKPGVLHRLMAELAGDAHISLEGDLSQCRFSDDLVISREEVGLLKRHTLAPSQDFVVLRLTSETIVPIYRQVMAAGLKHAIIHVQIERNGVLEFGAYDNFHPNCVMTGPAIGVEVLEDLKSENAVRDFGVAAASRPAGQAPRA
jgi:hypothetical protein